MEPKHAPIEKTKLPNIKNIIIIASGKGGVGKSTVAAGLALSLAREGFSTGLLDADIYGPSVPVLFNLQGKKPELEEFEGKKLMIPFEKFGIKLMSIGFFLNPEDPVLWRGPLASGGLNQLITETNWGNLDYLIIDTPPGTGDIHITLVQKYNITGSIIVTTPQNIALSDVKKAISMFQSTHVNVNVLGIVENMAWFTPSIHPLERYYLFGKGGGNLLSKEFGLPLLSQIPLNEKLCETCDEGKLNDFFNESMVKLAFEKLIQSITKN